MVTPMNKKAKNAIIGILEKYAVRKYIELNLIRVTKYMGNIQTQFKRRSDTIEA